MILYPAIDLRDGVCVRLQQGDMARATVFARDPAAQAAAFAAAGSGWLHVVDLNGAFDGRPVNAGAVRSILAATDCQVQLGGGLRNMAAIEFWLAAGVSRVVLGTAAVRDPDLTREACRRFPGRVAVGIDARNGRVAVAGWAESSGLRAEDLAARFADAGVAALIHTDIARDGMLAGPNMAATEDLAAATAIPVIASGGIASLDDLARLRESGRIAGAVIGRALYEGRFTLADALSV